MKYLLLIFDNEKYWFEIDDENFACRQIILDENGIYHISCIEDCLAEGQVVIENLDGKIFDLAKSEFEKVWQFVLEDYRTYWEEIKEKYPVGCCVTGVVNCFIRRVVSLKVMALSRYVRIVILPVLVNNIAFM